jgi:hypothetical protein
MNASMYVPNADVLAGAPGSDLPGAVRTAEPKIGDPTLWLIALVAIWAGLIRFGVGVSVGK